LAIDQLVGACQLDPASPARFSVNEQRPVPGSAKRATKAINPSIAIQAR
jgi:hypothetical protein